MKASDVTKLAVDVACERPAPVSPVAISARVEGLADLDGLHRDPAQLIIVTIAQGLRVRQLERLCDELRIASLRAFPC